VAIPTYDWGASITDRCLSAQIAALRPS
jgi:hypothetical protein